MKTKDTLLLDRRSLLVGAATLASVTMLPGMIAPAHAALASTFRPTGSASLSHGAFSKLLGQYVTMDGDGMTWVRYGAFKSGGHKALKAYVASLVATDPTSLSRREAYAYWMNLYNAVTLEVVLDRWPVTAIKQIKLGGGGLFGTGPWSKKLVTVNGVGLSLDDIEHEILRGGVGDARVHYGVNCASYSCPNLPTKAFTGANLNAMLTEGARLYVNHPRGVSVKGGRTEASKIYSWYAGDFGGKGRLKQHWLEFAKGAHADAIGAASLGGFNYDWSINNAR